MQNPYEPPRSSPESAPRKGPLHDSTPGVVSQGFALLLGGVGVPGAALGLFGMWLQSLERSFSPDDKAVTLWFVCTGLFWALAARAFWRGKKGRWLLALAPVPVLIVVALAVAL